MYRRNNSGGFFLFLAVLFGVPFFLNGGFLLIPLIILLSLIFLIYVMFFQKDENGETEMSLERLINFLDLEKKEKETLQGFGCFFIIGLFLFFIFGSAFWWGK